MNELTKSYSIRGIDGNDVAVSETVERKEIVLSIQQNDDRGRVATVRLTKNQWEMLCETRFDLHVEGRVYIG